MNTPLLLLVMILAIAYAIVRTFELQMRIDRLERAVGLKKGG